MSETTVSVRILHMQSHLDSVCRLPVPGQQFIESVDRMSVDHALKHIAQVGIGFNIVKLASLDERAQHGPAHAASIAAREQMILATESHRTDRALNWIGVELDTAIMQEPRQSIPPRQCIADRFSKLAAAGQRVEAAPPSKTQCCPPGLRVSAPRSNPMRRTTGRELALQLHRVR